MLGKIFMSIKNIGTLLNVWVEDGRLVEDYYNRKIEKYTVTNIASLDWHTLEKHEKFLNKVFLRRLHSRIESILDIGCGTGRLIDYMTRKNIDFMNYEGVDVNKKFIQYAKKCHRGKNIHFFNKNFISKNYAPKCKYDLVANIGGLNSKQRYPYQYLKYNLEKMINLSSNYVVFNLIIKVNDLFFGKNSKKRTLGLIHSFPEYKLMKILDSIKDKYEITYKVVKMPIFKGSIDAFVYIFVK
jgi:SAM-dependent methyltransferase